jgi:hypothetical protein
MPDINEEVKMEDIEILLPTSDTSFHDYPKSARGLANKTHTTTTRQDSRKNSSFFGR